MITELEILKIKCWQLETSLETRELACRQQHALVVALEEENKSLRKQLDMMGADLIRAAG